MDCVDDEELRRIRKSKVAIVGLGATGSAAAEHLARHGVDLILIDRDFLENSDLYSSGIYSESQVERSLPKVEAAAERLLDFCSVETRLASLELDNLNLLEGAEIAVDGTDNLRARRCINYWSQTRGKPWLHTAAVAAEGHSAFLEEECFECGLKGRKKERVESCETLGVMREVSTIAGSLSAMKAVSHLAGQKLDEKLERVRREDLEIESDGCRVCEDGQEPKIERRKVKELCGKEKYQVKLEEADLGRAEEALEDAVMNDWLVRGKLGGSEITLFEDGRAIVEARTVDHAEQKLSELGV